MKHSTFLPFAQFVGLISVFTLVLFTGCGKVETAAPGNSASETGQSTGTAEKTTNNADLQIVGDWRLDAEETIKANDALLKNPRMDANAFRTLIRSMVSDFYLDEDNTLSCYEKANGIELDITGRWELKGNKIVLYQEFENGEAKKDELVGTVDGDRMDLVHEEGGMKLNMVLKKWTDNK
jgi:hypothetical protein